MGGLSLDEFKTLINSTSRGGPQFGSLIYINKEGEVVGLMAHPLLLPFMNLINLKDINLNIMNTSNA